MPSTVEVLPSASRLTGSLRDIGYDFATAVADVVDNSVAAGAERVDIRTEFDGAASRVMIVDDGVGMTGTQLNEALRFGSSRAYRDDDLGKFGLGLKTASLSQCTRLVVLSRVAPKLRRIESRVLDLNWIRRSDSWAVLTPKTADLPTDHHAALKDRPGTVVVWEGLDRVLAYADPGSRWAERRLDQLADETASYLSMVFHRYLSGDIPKRKPLTITVNGEVLRPWDPFARDEPATKSLGTREFQVDVNGIRGRVRLQPFVLPPRDQFNSAAEFERLGGPARWNRQQGLYFYRAGRLIQHGGWSGLRTIDEHTKLARAAVDFEPSLDDLFQVNVAKMRVALPAAVRAMIEKPVTEMCLVADSTYRSSSPARRPSNEESDESVVTRTPAASIGFALRAAAMEIGESDSLERVLEVVQRRAPEVTAALGWNS